MNKILFLDVDGVLNTRPGSLDDSKLVRLSGIINQTGALIVVCSTWRKYPHMLIRLRKALEDRGMAIHSLTPEKTHLPGKSGEIIQWIADDHMRQVEASGKTFPEGHGRMIILDDDNMDGLKGWHLRTKTDVGLTREIADEAVKRLNEPLPDFNEALGAHIAAVAKDMDAHFMKEHPVK